VKTYILVIVALFGISIHAQQPMSAEQARDDLKFAENVLKEAHPGLYRYNSKEEIDSLFEAAKSKITDSMTRQDLYRVMIPVMSRIGCGHTKFHPDDNWNDNYFFNRDKLFPLRLHIQGDKAFILGGYKDENIKPGSEILRINNQPVTDIIRAILPCSFSDGRNTTFKFIELSRFFSGYYANIIGAPDSFQIQYSDGIIKTVTLAAIPYEKIEAFQKSNESNESHLKPYELTISGNDPAIIAIRSFWMGSNKNYIKFLKESFSLLREKQVQNLIIDLRDNEGGNDARGALLLSYLMDKDFRYYDRLEMTTDKKFSFAENAHLPKFYGILRRLISHTDSGTYLWKHSKNLKVQKPAKEHFDGRVIVLINGASFSVTSEFAAAAHYYRRATFIGEETGGGYYGDNSGTFAIVTLPHSRINIGIPLVGYYMAVKDYPYPDHGVIPDLKVNPTAEDVINENDVVMNTAVKYIMSTSH
jgi:hypothetical protein